MKHENIAIKMKCRDCGHEQIVRGFRVEHGGTYFGSGYNWCDKCDIGLPVFVEEVEVDDRKD